MLLMSNSLKVVNIALVFCASFNLLAIFIRMRFIFTLCSDLVPAISFFLRHFRRNSQEHQDIIDLLHTHSIQVRQYAGARNPAHHVGVLHYRVEQVRGADHAKTTKSYRRDGAVHTCPHFTKILTWSWPCVLIIQAAQ